ncbi:GNAT family N-acetyltransferase [Spirosoma endbachense]|uniref:GNAT family N-acetyltransferase n=1 Tax=Spirosoma endbachense TaxID=2666025 RepID=A0A6P1VYK6_9BACT|nr:GNAT family N-acetyltransferase [Spirosoma endbachense]QHV96486.1 GNAT family N-acetyltransferase [Spirosoma endbachense]
MLVEIHKAQLADLEQLQQICVDAYSQNFAHHWHKGGLDWYLDQQFSPGQLRQAIESAETDYYLIFKDKLPVGFCKLGYSKLTEPHELWLELEKIYMLPTEKGSGIGKTVLDMVIQIAEEMGKKELLLYVIDTNQAAIRFYERNGFSLLKKTRMDLPYFKEELKGAWQMMKRL